MADDKSMAGVASALTGPTLHWTSYALQPSKSSRCIDRLGSRVVFRRQRHSEVNSNQSIRFSVKTLAWIVLGTLLTAQAATAAERGGEKVRIAVSSKSLGFFDTWAARERGFYRNHGLDAEIIAMRPPVAAAALQAGEIDYNFGASTTLRASISGLPVKVVSLSVRSSFHTLTAKSNIKSMADLKGKVIARHHRRCR